MIVNDFISLPLGIRMKIIYFEATFSDTDYPIEAGYIWLVRVQLASKPYK